MMQVLSFMLDCQVSLVFSAADHHDDRLDAQCKMEVKAGMRIQDPVWKSRGSCEKRVVSAMLHQAGTKVKTRAKLCAHLIAGKELLPIACSTFNIKLAFSCISRSTGFLKGKQTCSLKHLRRSAGQFN